MGTFVKKRREAGINRLYIYMPDNVLERILMFQQIHRLVRSLLGWLEPS